VIRAVTFDLWDTLVFDDSDEPRRAAAGLKSKAETREALFVDEVLAHHPQLGAERAAAAYAHLVQRFRHHWKVEHHTPSVADRLLEGFRFLELDPTPGFDAVVHAFSVMEVEIPPDPVPNVVECLQAVSETYRVGIISDAIVTPGSGLREILAGHGLRDFFEVFVFSDEAGASKPARKVFDVAVEGLGVELHELVHVGDREANDIVGPHGVGAKAVLYTGAIDRGSATTKADAVCTDLADLPGILATL
jgi:putative hydrolase of the HAD superfamily